MARRKNVKRIDPRYFLHETVNRNDDGSALQEDIPAEPDWRKSFSPAQQRQARLGTAEKEEKEERRKAAAEKARRAKQHADATNPEARCNQPGAEYDPDCAHLAGYEEGLLNPGQQLEEGCPPEDEGGAAIDISGPGTEVHVDDISQLSPEEAFAAGMAAARDAINQAMGGPDEAPPEGGFSGNGPMGEPAMQETMGKGIPDYIKSTELGPTIPMGSLTNVLVRNPEILQVIKSDSIEKEDLEQKAQAFAQVGELLAQDPDIAPIAAKAGGVDNILDVKGLIRFADENGLLSRLS